MKPHWQKLHDWWKDDFKVLVDEREFFCELLVKHPGEPLYIDTVKDIDKCIQSYQRKYKKLYGKRFNLRRVENEE